MSYPWIQDGAQSAAFQSTLAAVSAEASRVFRVQNYWLAAHSDYTIAVQNAAAAAHAAGGGMVWFDGDTDAVYDVSKFVITSKHNLTFAGNGATIRRRAGLVSPDTTRFAEFVTCNDLKINGLTWDNNGLERFGGIGMYGCHNVWIWGNYLYDSNLHDDWRTYDHFGFVFLNEESTTNAGTNLHIWGNIAEDIELLEFEFVQNVHCHNNISRRAAGTCAIGTFFLNATTNPLVAITNNSIHHNKVIDPRKKGITVQHEAAGPDDVVLRNHRITDNTIEHRAATVGSGTTSNTFTTITGVTGTFAVGQYIFGTNIPANAYITAVVGTTLTISAAATGSGSVTLTSTYAGPSSLIDFTTSAGTGTNNNLSHVRIENNTLWVDPALPAGSRSGNHLRLFHRTGNVWSNVVVRGNTIHANTTDWPMDIRNVTDGRIENNEIYGAGALGINFSALTNCRVANNRAAATTSSFQFGTSGGNNVLDNNRALGTPTNVWAVASAVVASDIVRSTAGHKSVVAAAALTLPLDAGDVVTITGNTSITSITATGLAGRAIHFIFSGTPTLTDGNNIKIGGNFVAAGTTNDPDGITLACDGTNWYEVGARSVN